MKYLKKFSNHNGYDGFINTDKFIRPNVSICKQENDVHFNHIEPYDYSQDYLTFEAIEDTTFTFSQNALQYSLDNGTTWSTLNSNTPSPSITAGNKIMWKQTGLVPISYSYDYVNSSYKGGIGTFTATGKFNIEGNIMSLLYGDNFKDQNSLEGKDYAFTILFQGNTKLINASNLILPATTLVSDCYKYMFKDCTALTTAPELPAIILVNNCYRCMFQGCTALTTTPELPATTLAPYCYINMFSGCTALITTAPELPATTLAQGCYQYMFSGCTALTTAPELPAITLTGYCYSQMFNGCTSLNYIKCLATNINANKCTTDWLTNVAASGTFVKAASMTSWTTGVNGIPSGWTVQDYVES